MKGFELEKVELECLIENLLREMERTIQESLGFMSDKDRTRIDIDKLESLIAKQRIYIRAYNEGLKVKDEP